MFFGLVRSAFGRRFWDFFRAMRGLPTTVNCLSVDVTVVFAAVTPARKEIIINIIMKCIYKAHFRRCHKCTKESIISGLIADRFEVGRMVTGR